MAQFVCVFGQYQFAQRANSWIIQLMSRKTVTKQSLVLRAHLPNCLLEEKKTDALPRKNLKANLRFQGVLKVI